MLFSSAKVFSQTIPPTPSICSTTGSTASITVTTDAASPRYAWYYKKTPTSSWVLINAAGVYSNYKTATLNITKTATSPVTGTSYKVVINGNLPSNEVVLTVTTAPKAGTISGTQGVCSNGTTTFTSTGDVGGKWKSLDETKATIIDSTGVITPVAAGTSTMTYTVKATGGCSIDATATRTVTVTATPNAGNISGTQAICSNGTTTFTSNGSLGGAWSSSDTAIATINASTGVITPVAAGISTMTYTVTGSGGCANATATQTVTVTATPNAGTVSGTQAICSDGTTTTFTSDGASGGAWTSSDMAKATVDPSTGVITPVAAGTSTITYTVTGSGGCANAIATLTVTVTAPLNPGNISGTQAICYNGTTTFTSDGDSGGKWTSSAIIKATINESTGVVTAVAGGVAIMRYTVGLGGCNTTATRTATITAAPNAGTISGAQTISSIETTTFTSNGDEEGEWTSSDTDIATVDSSTGAVTAVAAGTSNITYTVTSSGLGCIARTTKTVTVIDGFITTWQIPNDNSDTLISLPAQPDAGNYTINWGDGTEENYTAEDTPSHSYISDNTGVTSERSITFKGTFNHLKFTDQTNLIGIQDWGTQKWTSMANMFEGCTSLIEFPSSLPDLSLCWDMSNMFYNATAFNQPLNSWDIGKVTNMSNMFYNATAFDQPLNSWDVSKVTNMYYMFTNASAFNQPLDLWDVSKVTNMTSMFENTTFDQPIGDWDIRSVTKMESMFYNTTLSTNHYDDLLTGWTTTYELDPDRKPKDGVVFSGGKSNYEEGATAHDNLKANYHWVITDGKFIPPTVITNNIDVCAGSASVDLTASITNSEAYPLKWYSTATGGKASDTAPSTLTKTNEKSGVKSFWVSRMRTETEESARAVITVTINALPTYISKTLLLTDTAGDGTTIINNLGYYIGTDKILKLTAEKLTDNPYKYMWALPENAIRTNATGTETLVDLNTPDEVIYIKFPPKDNTPAKNTTCKVTYITKDLGCISQSSKTLLLSRTTPSALTKLTLTDGAKEILNVGPYLGVNQEFFLTAGYTTGTTPIKELQANTYQWVLPAGVTSDATETLVANTYTSTNASINVNFEGVDKQTGDLTIKVYPNNAIGKSTLAKTITLKRTLPTAPSTLKLTISDDSTVAITNISPYFKVDKTLTLTAAYSKIPMQGLEATSYKWTLSDGITSSDAEPTSEIGVYTSTTNIIHINFKDASRNVKNTYTVSINAVNNTRSSLIKTLPLPGSVPRTAPTTVAGPLTVCNRPIGFTYTIAATALATEYLIKAPIGSIVTSSNSPSNTTNELTTSDLKFNVVYLGAVSEDTKQILTVDSKNGIGTSQFGAKTLSVTKKPNCNSSTPTTREAVVTTKAFDKNNITLYPNPTASILNIKVGANHTKQTYTIANALGKIVLEGKLNKDNTPINVEHLSKGIYFIRLDNTNTSTFIKE